MALTMHRPARIISGHQDLDAEFESARWVHHRLLDFEDEHAAELDRVAEQIAPGILRCARLLAILTRRAKRAQRTAPGAWSPVPHPELHERLRERLSVLRKERDADPRWKEALRWADAQVGEPKKLRRRRAKDPAKLKQRKAESDEAWAKRLALLTTDETEEHFAAKVAAAPRDTRRDVYRKELYARRRCHWATWNGVMAQVEQARSAVLVRRGAGLSAAWRRPRWDSDHSIYGARGSFRVVERGKPWWVVEVRVGTDAWVRFKAKFGTWHQVPDGTALLGLQLTRRRDGERWAYWATIVADMDKPTEPFASRGLVAFDWGHREHGHPEGGNGLRAFTWLGDDGGRGVVVVPTECRTALDEIDEIKGRLDAAYNARKVALQLPEPNRYAYRRRVMRSGVRTAEQTYWLRWERSRERRVMRLRKRVKSLRAETYLRAVRALRGQYAVFAFEAEESWSIKKQAKDDAQPRRRRSNRDLTARYEFVSLCERFGAALIRVSARNTTRECPDCGVLGQNGPELLYACPGCGRVRDKDEGAARVILRRAQEALAKQDQSA